MRLVEFADGLAINGIFGDPEVSKKILETSGKLQLITNDCPYFNIVNETWDQTKATDIQYCNQLIQWTQACEAICNKRREADASINWC